MSERSPIDYCPYCGSDQISLALDMGRFTLQVFNSWQECQCGANWKWPPAAKGVSDAGF